MKYLSTGKAAKLLSVTPDTILKWIKQGRIPALRTAGGHHRISREYLESMLRIGQIARKAKSSHNTIHCWEYFAENGNIREGCKHCLVQRAGAINCYEMSALSQESGLKCIFCETSCEDCPYYRELHQELVRVLIITDKEELRSEIDIRECDGFSVRFTSCEYECSMLVDTFRPNFVVIDCAMPFETCRELFNHLKTDPRIPDVNIILAVSPETKESRAASFHGIHSQILRPFSLSDLKAHLKKVGATQERTGGERTDPIETQVQRNE